MTISAINTLIEDIGMATGILYVDDHEIFHDCIKNMFDTRQDMQIVAIANNGQSAVRLSKELRPDVVVMDIRLPGLNGIDATRMIREVHPRARIIGLSGYTDRDTVLAMMRVGANGYVVKSAAFTELLQAIEVVISGKMYLSPSITSVVMDQMISPTLPDERPSETLLTLREREVLGLVAEGLSSKEVADRLCVSPKTVETHRSRIMKKLAVDNFADLVKYAIREGITTL